MKEHIFQTISKKQIEKAGKAIAKDPGDENAIKVLAEFRQGHAEPLQSIYMNLKRQAKAVQNDSIVSQRLKRMSAIIGKLERFPTMNLSSMQDIGGCRAIFKRLTSVYECRKRLVRGASKNNPPKKEYDYIENPKDSGYRGIHIVYQHHSYGGLIEIQLRTNLQHYWSTAVETVGLFTGEALKSSQGNTDWLYFFRLISQAFSFVEGTTLRDDLPKDVKELQEQIRHYMEKLQVQEILTGYASAIRIQTEKLKDNCYILMKLDIKEKSIGFIPHSPKELDMANALYAGLEQKYRNDPCVQIVLISLNSAKSLKKAYPNYFADTTELLRAIHKFLAI